MLQEEANTLHELSFDQLIGQKLAIEAELDERANTELVAIKERLELIATYKGVEVSELLQKKQRKKRETRQTDEPPVVEELPIAAE